MKTQNLITQAIDYIGLTKMATACGKSYQAVRKWEKAGRLPRTEWTGETNYAAIIERESGGKITRDMLLNTAKLSCSP
jgi:hypothetical protein